MDIVTEKFIDGNFSFCHAPTIVEHKNTLFCAWFSGDNEGHRESGIYLSVNEGEEWSKAINVAKGFLDNKQVACWNPVLFSWKKDLYLFYKVGIMPSWWRGMMICSKNSGLNWSEPKLLPSGFYGPIKNKPVQLKDGKILCGSSCERKWWNIHLEYTYDFINWKKIGPLNDDSISLIQPTILVQENKIIILCRNSDKHIFTSFSTDEGATWSPFCKLELLCANSGIDATSLVDNKILLVHNNSLHRSSLHVTISEDAGISWKSKMELENDIKYEYSYPSVIQSMNQKIHIVYSWKYQKIKHVVLNQKNF